MAINKKIAFLLAGLALLAIAFFAFPNLFSPASDKVLEINEQLIGNTPETENFEGGISNNESDFRFIGRVLTIQEDSTGALFSQVSQDSNQPGSNSGLIDGFKGDVRVIHNSCVLRERGTYTLHVTYSAAKNAYDCTYAGLVMYE